jgi:hypothetical protein
MYIDCCWPHSLSRRSDDDAVAAVAAVAELSLLNPDLLSSLEEEYISIGAYTMAS